MDNFTLKVKHFRGAEGTLRHFDIAATEQSVNTVVSAMAIGMPFYDFIKRSIPLISRDIAATLGNIPVQQVRIERGYQNKLFLCRCCVNQCGMVCVCVTDCDCEMLCTFNKPNGLTWLNVGEDDIHASQLVEQCVGSDIAEWEWGKFLSVRSAIKEVVAEDFLEQVNSHEILKEHAELVESIIKQIFPDLLLAHSR